MPQRYIIAGDEIEPYLVIMNSHDGSSGVKVAMTPIRVVCQNTLNLALNSANRIWAARPYRERPQPGAGGQRNLRLAELYMSELGRGVNELAKIKLSDRKAMDLMQNFFPISEDLSDIQRKNNLRMLDDLKRRYFDAPDLLDMGKKWLPVRQRSQRFCHPCRAHPQDPKTIMRTSFSAPSRATP